MTNPTPNSTPIIPIESLANPRVPLDGIPEPKFLTYAVAQSLSDASPEASERMNIAIQCTQSGAAVGADDLYALGSKTLADMKAVTGGDKRPLRGNESFHILIQLLLDIRKLADDMANSIDNVPKIINGIPERWLTRSNPSFCQQHFAVDQKDDLSVLLDRKTGDCPKCDLSERISST